MRFYWEQDRIKKNHTHIFWEEGKKNLADYITKKQPIRHHRNMRPRYLKPTTKEIETQKTGKMQS